MNKPANMNKLTAWTSSIFAFLVSISLFLSCTAENRNSAELIPVTVGITSFIGEAASFVAEEKGFFKENGLDVTLQINNAGSESVRQLISGTIDIAHVAETPAIFSTMDEKHISADRKDDLQIVANMILANRIQKVIGRYDSGIEHPQDIRGKRVALAADTQLEYLLDSFLLEHQIGMEEIDTVHMNVHDQVAAFKNGEIDVAVVWEPHATNLLYYPEELAVELPTRLTYSTMWLVVVLDRYSEENPEVVSAYLRSLLKAQKYIRENPQWAVQLLSERTGVHLEVVTKAMRQIDYELSLSERTLSLLKEQKNWMIYNGYTASSDRSVIELINFRFMEEVYPEGITLIR